MVPNVEIVHDEKFDVGEGPHWDHEAQVLYYVDALNSTVLKYVPSTKKITRVVIDKQAKATVSFVIPLAGTKDKFVIAYGKKLAVLTWDGISADPTSVEILIEVDPGLETTFNDGKADPRGRVWAGTMLSEINLAGDQVKKGSLYSLGAHGKSVEAHVTGIGISNGLTWSSDHKTFYYIDSSNWAVHGFDYDIDSGKIANQRTVFDLKKNNVEGLPDGMTIDKEDKLWFATFRGNAIHRVDPKTGSLMQSVKLPASQITSVAWGGPNLDELYVTSASITETVENPYSGRLFKITGLGTSGFPGVPAVL